MASTDGSRSKNFGLINQVCTITLNSQTLLATLARIENSGVVHVSLFACSALSPESTRGATRITNVRCFGVESEERTLILSENVRRPCCRFRSLMLWRGGVVRVFDRALEKSPTLASSKLSAYRICNSNCMSEFSVPNWSSCFEMSCSVAVSLL